MIETKRYSDGTSATGPGPLPDLSPEQQREFVAEFSEDDATRAYGCLRRLFEVCAPQCAAMPTLTGISLQIDNLIAGYRIKLGEMLGPAAEKPTEP